MITSQLKDSMSFLALISLYGALASNPRLLAQAQRPNLRQLQMPLVNCSGFRLSYVILELLFPLLLFFGAIIWVPLILRSILSCTPVRSTLMLIITLYVIELLLTLLGSLSYPDQLDDLFTKPFSIHRFSFLGTSLYVRPIQLGLRGDVGAPPLQAQSSS